MFAAQIDFDSLATVNEVVTINLELLSLVKKLKCVLNGPELLLYLDSNFEYKLEDVLLLIKVSVYCQLLLVFKSFKRVYFHELFFCKLGEFSVRYLAIVVLVEPVEDRVDILFIQNNLKFLQRLVEFVSSNYHVLIVINVQKGLVHR